jgi:hypothetical protein
MMQKIELITKYGWATAKIGRYSNGHVGIQLFQDGMPLVKISANLPDTNIEPREFHFNSNDAGSMKEDVLKSGHYEDTGNVYNSGWCEYPVFKLKDHVEIVEN